MLTAITIINYNMIVVTRYSLFLYFYIIILYWFEKIVRTVRINTFENVCKYEDKLQNRKISANKRAILTL